jgi:hypothetical protein
VSAPSEAYLQGVPALSESNRLLAAVERIISGAARVRVSVRAEFENAFDDVDLRGVVDFNTDRCALDGEEDGTMSTRLAGPDTYARLEDGRWTLDHGRPGTWGLFHPHAPLEAVRRARERAVALPDGRFHVDLNRDELDQIISAGISKAWRPHAEVSVNEHGDLSSVQLVLVDENDSNAWIHTLFEFERCDGPVVVDLPPAEMTITTIEHIEELQRHRPDS